MARSPVHSEFSKRLKSNHEATNQTSVQSSWTTAAPHDSINRGGCEVCCSKCANWSAIYRAGSGSARRSQSADQGYLEWHAASSRIGRHQRRWRGKGIHRESKGGPRTSPARRRRTIDRCGSQYCTAAGTAFSESGSAAFGQRNLAAGFGCNVPPAGFQECRTIASRQSADGAKTLNLDHEDTKRPTRRAKCVSPATSAEGLADEDEDGSSGGSETGSPGRAKIQHTVESRLHVASSASDEVLSEPASRRG